jgi:hypothetical protein
MEPQPAYWDFDDSLREVIELWIEMADEFKEDQRIVSPAMHENVNP